MNLTLLTPWPALAVAAAAVPALLILYFLKLRRRPVRISSTLLWEQATRDLQVNIPFRLLRPTWLLFLQLLILALFLLALARPALNMGSGPRERVVLLIDRSASMSARDGDPASGSSPRLDEAKRRALNTLDELSRTAGGSSFAVVEFSAAPRIASGFTQDTGAARSAIAALQASDQPGNLAAALRLAGAMLTGEATESARPEPGMVILFSDGSFPPPADGYTLTGADFRYERIGSDGDPSRVPSLPPSSGRSSAQASQSRDNLGIVALSARRDWDDPSTVRLFIRLRNAGSGTIAAPVSLSLDGVEIDRKPVEVPGDRPADAAVPPADTASPESVATFTLNRREGGILTVAIDRRDLLVADNSASLILEAATKPRILLVIPDPPTTPGTDDPPALRGPEWLITTVLQEMQVPFRTIRASTYEREMAGDQPPQADLFIFDRVAPSRPPFAPSLSFGAGLPSEGLSLAPPPANSPGTYILSWNRAHPLLRHVALDTVYISQPMGVIQSGESPAELARGATGSLMLLLEGRGPRRIVVAFELAYSNWPITVSFTIFLAQAVDHLTMRAAEHAGRAFTTSEPVWVDVPPSQTRLTLDGPQRLERDASTGQATPAGLRRVNLGILERAGVYQVEGAPQLYQPGSPTPALALNLLDPTETALAVADHLRIGGESITGSGRGQEPLELWPHLVAIALALLVLEWFLNAWFMRI